MFEIQYSMVLIVPITSVKHFRWNAMGIEKMKDNNPRTQGKLKMFLIQIYC